MTRIAIQAPSVQTAPGSFNIPIATFPVPAKSTAIDVNKVAADITTSINAAIANKDYSALSKLFTETGYWRDHLALTWEFRTAQGHGPILQLLQKAAGSKDGFRLVKVEVDDSVPHRAPKVQALDPQKTVPGVHFFVRVETVVGRGVGVVHAVEENGVWKLFTLYTSLREIKGHEERTYKRRPAGVEHGGIPGRMNWAERRQLEVDFKDGSEPAVFIVG